MIKIPQIGDIVMSPHSKVKDELGVDKFDLLECDGGAVDDAHLSLAEKLISVWGYTGTSYAILNPYGLCWDGTHFWSLIYDTGVIAQYTTDGTATGISFDTGRTSTERPMDLTWDGTHFWILTSNRVTLKYDVSYQLVTSWNYVFNSDYPNSICWDGEYLCTVDANEQYITRATREGVYIDKIAISGAGENLFGIAYMEGNYITGSDANSGGKFIKEWTKNGTYVKTLFQKDFGSVSYIEYTGDGIVILDRHADNLSEYIEIKSLPNLTAKDVRVPYKIVADLTA